MADFWDMPARNYLLKLTLKTYHNQVNNLITMSITAHDIKRILQPLGRPVSVRKVQHPLTPGLPYYSITITTKCHGDQTEVLYHSNQLLAPIHHPNMPVDTVPLANSGDTELNNRERFTFNYTISCQASN